MVKKLGKAVKAGLIKKVGDGTNSGGGSGG